MPYQISREGKLYGPYTLEELQRYVTSGNVSPADLARSEETAPWAPVSQILGASSASAPAGAAQFSSACPNPPNLHWELLLLLNLLTCNVFSILWDFVQARWVKRVAPESKVFSYLIAYVLFSILYLIRRFNHNFLTAMGYPSVRTPLLLISTGWLIALWIALLMALVMYRLAMKDAIERHFNGPEPIGLRLGPFMTVFFGGLYFQYHFNRINRMKQVGS